jgi:uncharacterized membrane protein
MVNTQTVLTSIHVLCAVLWIGGNATLNIATTMALRSGDPVFQSNIFRTVGLIGPRFFQPLSIVLLASGIWLVAKYDTVFSFSDFWISYGMAVIVLTIAVGMGFLGPRSGKIAGLLDQGADQDTVQVTATPFKWVARADLLMLLSAVVIMVIKPA